MRSERREVVGAIADHVAAEELRPGLVREARARRRAEAAFRFLAGQPAEVERDTTALAVSFSRHLAWIRRRRAGGGQ